MSENQLYFAPMEGITGSIYRRAHHRIFGGVDRYYAPFIFTNPKGKISKKDLLEIAPEYNEGCRVVPQLLSNCAEDFIATAHTLKGLGYDEVNLNLGCPSSTVASKGRGSGFLGEKEALKAFLADIFDKTDMKISLKTRIGLNRADEFDDILDIYQAFPVEMLIVHPRIRMDYYSGKPDMEAFEKASARMPFPVCYNGDIFTAAAYGYGVHYFTDHFLPGSQVNGFNCSYKTADETEKLLAKEVQAYVLTVETRNNGKESITAKEAGLVYKPDGGARKLIKKQDRYKWFLAFNQKKKYTLATDTTYEDQNKLTETVKKLKCMQKDKMEKPVDACIKDTGESYEIQPEKEGTTLDTKKVQKVIRKAVSAGDVTVSLEKNNCYKKPSVYKDDKTLKKECDQMNKLTSCVITYDFSDRSEQLDRNTIKDWLVKDANGDYSVDKNQVAAYVNSLGYKYDTFGCTRTFTTYDGRQKTIQGGDYGWAIDQTTETEWLYNAILAGTTEV